MSNLEDVTTEELLKELKSRMHCMICYGWPKDVKTRDETFFTIKGNVLQYAGMATITYEHAMKEIEKVSAEDGNTQVVKEITSE